VGEGRAFDDLHYFEQKEVSDKFADVLKRGSLYQKHRFAVLPELFQNLFRMSCNSIVTIASEKTRRIRAR
jgi:hypothetical protein